MNGSTETSVTFEGVEYGARIEFVVTDWGAKPIIDYVNGGDPGWGPEWDVEAIWLTPIGEDGDLGEEFLAKGVRFAPLYNHPDIDGAVYERVSEMKWEGV